MKTDKMFFFFRIAALVTAIVDALFIIFGAVILGLFLGSVMLVPDWFGKLCLAIIIVNGSFLCVVAAYLIFRKQ